MVISRLLKIPQNKINSGFMLLEVLIALFIIALLMAALIKSTTDNARDLIIIKNKTIASWAASNMLANIQLGLLTPSSSKINLTVTMLNQQWAETATFQPIPPNSWQVDIEVRPTSFKTQSVFHLVGYFSQDIDGIKKS